MKMILFHCISLVNGRSIRMVIPLAILLLGLLTTSFSQWSANPSVNTAVCALLNSSQTFPVVVSDGLSGAIVAWKDYRNGNWDIYAQRLNASGLRQWGDSGVAICTAPTDQEDIKIVTDGSGGAIIAWRDYRNSNLDMFAQRINASGIVQWTTDGVGVCTETHNQYSLASAADGSGGAIIAWSDSRNGNMDIYAQRIDASGILQWPDTGVAVCAVPYSQDIPAIVSDGAGGAIITWEDYRIEDSYSQIYTQRVSGSGILQWPDTGVAVCTVPEIPYRPKIAANGIGGAIIIWEDYRNGNYDIYAQRIGSSGTAQWPDTGIAISAASSDQVEPAIVTDGSGGAIMTWEDRRNSTPDIYAQRMDATGTIQWTSNGIAVCSLASLQVSPKLCAVGSDGAIIAWEDGRNGSSFDIYAQSIDGSGAAQWTTNGVAASKAPNTQRFVNLVPDGSGGAIVTWEDDRSGSAADWDVYAQHLASSVPSGIVLLISPANRSSDQPNNPTLTWYRTGDALSYHVKVATDTTMTTMVKDTTVNDTTLALSGLGYISAYFWQVSGANSVGDGPWSPVWKFNTMTNPVPTQQVILVLPADGATGQSLNPVLRWHRTSDALFYHVKAAIDTTFGTTVKDTTVTDTSLALNNLQYSTQYVWKVSGAVFVGDGPWSDIRHFTTIPPPPPNAPALIDPVNGATNQLATPTLRWRTSAYADGYTVQFARSATFGGGGIFTARTLHDTTLDVGPLSKNTTYYWHVQANRDTLQSAWSQTWSFTTMNLSVPRAPALLSPRNRATGVASTVTLQWKASSGATGYRVVVQVEGVSPGPVADTVTSLLSYTVDSLNDGTTYLWHVAALGPAGQGDWSKSWEFTTAGFAKNVPNGIPESFQLEQNYPNPFNPATVFAYALPVDAHVRMTLYNTIGQIVALLVDGVQEAGYQQVNWDAGAQAAGVYFYRLEATAIADPANQFVHTRKMILVK